MPTRELFDCNGLMNVTTNASCLPVSSSSHCYVFNCCSTWNGSGVVMFLFLFGTWCEFIWFAFYILQSTHV